MQVLSSSVANALWITFGDEAAGTAYFCEMFDKFFDCLNVSNFDAGKRTRNAFKSPYRSRCDFWLKVLFLHVVYIIFELIYKFLFPFDMQWLREEFLPYLDRWEESVFKREGFSNVEKKMMLLSQETRNGLRITGIHV